MTRAPPPAARKVKPTRPLPLNAHRRRRQAPDSGPRPLGTGWRMPDLAGAGSGPIGTEPHEWPPADVVSMERNCIGGRTLCVNCLVHLRLLRASAACGPVSVRSPRRHSTVVVRWLGVSCPPPRSFRGGRRPASFQRQPKRAQSWLFAVHRSLIKEPIAVASMSKRWLDDASRLSLNRRSTLDLNSTVRASA
jgi:hypothetical protein